MCWQLEDLPLVLEPKESKVQGKVSTMPWTRLWDIKIHGGSAMLVQKNLSHSQCQTSHVASMDNDMFGNFMDLVEAKRDHGQW